jgi:hypothetical protein
MPDITMCPGGECPLKETCYRFKANPSSWQSFFHEPPYKIEYYSEGKNISCEYYWKYKQEK